MATDITILSGIGDGDVDGDNTFQGDVSAVPGTILATDNAPTSIFESRVEGIAAATNISVAATNSIAVDDLADDSPQPRPDRGQFGDVHRARVHDGRHCGHDHDCRRCAYDQCGRCGGDRRAQHQRRTDHDQRRRRGEHRAGLIAGADTALTKAGAGTLTLSGTNTYTGATRIDGGLLSIGADANLGTAPGAATPDHLTFDGGTLQTTATFALNANRGVTFNAGGGTIETASATTLTYGGIAAGAGSLTKTGTGDLLLAERTATAGRRP